jgi:hypothetical protein
VAQHRGRVVRADHDEVEAAEPVGRGQQLDVAGLAHRAGVERGDLAHILVGGADEAGGVRELGDVHRPGVDVVPVEPAAEVEIEISPDGADEGRTQAQQSHAEGDVRGDAATPDHEVVHQERQRHLVQLVGQQLFGESTREVHQMVGGDRTRDGDPHVGNPCKVDGRTSACDSLTRRSGTGWPTHAGRPRGARRAAPTGAALGSL